MPKTRELIAHATSAVLGSQQCAWIADTKGRAPSASRRDHGPPQCLVVPLFADSRSAAQQQEAQVSVTTRARASSRQPSCFFVDRTCNGKTSMTSSLLGETASADSLETPIPLDLAVTTECAEPRQPGKCLITLFLTKLYAVPSCFGGRCRVEAASSGRIDCCCLSLSFRDCCSCFPVFAPTIRDR